MIDSLENIYVFIVWSKVKWCRGRIVNDLEKCFEIVKIINVDWDQNLYVNNLSSFYGSKISDYKKKINKIGNKEFTVIIVKDENPIFEQKRVFDQYQKVNINVFNKKKIYREWTGTNFRVHSSDNELETKHDLCVLFGPDFLDLINTDNKEINIKNNTYRFKQLSNVEELEKALYYFGCNIFVKSKKEYYIYALNKINIIYFLNISKIDKNKYEIKINNENKIIYLFGEEEGELPLGFVNKAKTNKNIINDFILLTEDYIEFLKNKDASNQSVKKFLDKYNFDANYSERCSIRNEENNGTIYNLKKDIKYVIARINNTFYSIKEKNEK